MYMNNTEPVEIDEYRLELENRIRNLLWTVSGDYQLDMKPDVSLFLRSKAIALYDGIKQGALARYYDKDMLGLYLVKKIFLQAGENELTFVAQLCIEEAIGDKICEERPGIRDMQRQCIEDILEQEFDIHKNRQIYWDDIPIFCYPEEYELEVYPMKSQDVREIDSVEELATIDESYRKYIM